jgi:hypothetical protein
VTLPSAWQAPRIARGLFKKGRTIRVHSGATRDRDARDAEILNKNAERLNREASDVLKYSPRI